MLEFFKCSRRLRGDLTAGDPSEPLPDVMPNVNSHTNGQ